MYLGFDYSNIARNFDISIYNCDVLRIMNRLFTILRFELRKACTFIKKVLVRCG
jgi:hypothetical protein